MSNNCNFSSLGGGGGKALFWFANKDRELEM
jgi:hypothetical protein